MIEAALIKKELITEALQLIIVVIILHRIFIKSRIDRRKKILFLAFLFYAVYLSFHILMRATHAELIAAPYPEVLGLFSHAFKALFFMTFGYALLDALIEDRLLRRILQSTTLLAFLILGIISGGIIAVEGVNLQFNETIKELVYELAEMMVQVMIINIAYQSWKETRSSNLILIGAAFSLYFIADFIHTYSLMWGLIEREFAVRHLVRLLALLLIAYTMLYHKEK
jgi:hypothetical protein